MFFMPSKVLSMFVVRVVKSIARAHGVVVIGGRAAVGSPPARIKGLIKGYRDYILNSASEMTHVGWNPGKLPVNICWL